MCSVTRVQCCFITELQESHDRPREFSSELIFSLGSPFAGEPAKELLKLKLKRKLLKLALPQAGSQGLNGHIKILGGEIALLEEAWCSGIVEVGKTLTGLSPFLNPTHK